jgi:hypothetical protein
MQLKQIIERIHMMKNKKQPLNLHDIKIPTDGESIEQTDYSKDSKEISVFFKNLDKTLINLISEADFVFGCVAWLTHSEVLKALAQKQTAIVVQKEDFLRPDMTLPNSPYTSLRALYGNLKCRLNRYCLLGIANSLSVCGDPSVAPIRCVGSHNSEKKVAWPRAHHKFLIFAKIEERSPGHDVIQPYAVWTGSFNITNNATMSFENAVLIRDPNIVEAFASEFGQIFALSEPLDWETPWTEPEYRIGT